MPILSTKTISQHHRILFSSPQRNHRTKNQGVGLSLIKREQIIPHVAVYGKKVGAVEHTIPVRVFARIQHTITVQILVHRLEHLDEFAFEDIGPVSLRRKTEPLRLFRLKS